VAGRYPLDPIAKLPIITWTAAVAYRMGHSGRSDLLTLQNNSEAIIVPH